MLIFIYIIYQKQIIALQQQECRLQITNNTKHFYRNIKKSTHNAIWLRGQKMIQQIQLYLEIQIAENEQNFPRIIEYFIFSSGLPTLSLLQKEGIILIFQRVCYAIKGIQVLETYLPELVGSILKFFNDPNDKVRFSAISSIYNIFKFLDDDCLVVFPRTFKQLPCIIIDPSADVRQAAAHLNHTMKTLLNNAILDHYDFNYEQFIYILTENFVHSHPLIKQFLIDWINTIDQIREFQITRYLPLFLKKLFLFLVDENKNVRIKAQECLNGFIQAFKLSFTCSKEQISKRYKLEETQSILILLIKIIQESIVFDSSSQIDIHVFTWLDSFCNFLLEQINQGMEPFLSKIIINIFPALFDILMKALSIQPQSIQMKIANIHENLLKTYPFLYTHQPEIQKAATYLDMALINCRSLTKTQIVLKWVNRMAQNNNQYVHKKINRFIEFLVEKICDFNSKFLPLIFQLLEGSIFISQYFSNLLHCLLLQLQKKRTPNQTSILSQIIGLSNSDYNLLLLCSQIISLQKQKYSKFKIRLAQILLGFLITEKSLREFQQNIKKKKINKKIFKTIALSLIESRAAYIVLCFLLRDYQTIIFIFNHIVEHEQTIDPSFLRSLFKMSNLLMHPSMHQLFLDMASTQPSISSISRKAYLSLIMFLPINRITNPLLQKAKQLTTETESFGFVNIEGSPDKINNNLNGKDKPAISQMHSLYNDKYIRGVKMSRLEDLED